MGVTVTRQSMIQHCRALTMACHYTEGETTVCVLDFKREGELFFVDTKILLRKLQLIEIFLPYLKSAYGMQSSQAFLMACMYFSFHMRS